MGEYGTSGPVTRFEDQRPLTGRGDFPEDGNAHRRLLGRVLRSPYAHAEIRSIDSSAAQAFPGVVAVVTERDYLDAGWQPIPHIGPSAKRRGGRTSGP